MRLPNLVILLTLAGVVQAADHGRVVSAARSKPTDPWQDHPTRLVEDLPGYQPGESGPLSRYGGLKADPRQATGFFRTEKIGARWWLIDPEGCRFINMAVVSVQYPQGGAPRAALKDLTPERWTDQTLSLLHEAGFNGAGAWSGTDRLRQGREPVAYTMIWNFMSSYGRQRGGIYQQAGHMGYPKDCIFVFDPQFEQFCDAYARQLEQTKDDPWLLGHFSDNELPFYNKSLDNFLALPATEPGRVAAERWLAEWRSAHPGGQELNDAMRDAFLGYVVDRYLAITTAAIRRHDPHHLCLGSRLHGSAFRSPGVLQAAGRHLDVVAINYYHAWSPDPELTANWVRWSGKPYLVTEWYAKGMDAGFKNTTGAGWVVRTQADRGAFYQNFTLGLLEQGGCVGWHWFKYRDNDPTDTKADPSNRDSNKGLVNLDLEPYPALLTAMRAVNRQAYRIVEYFDRAR